MLLTVLIGIYFLFSGMKPSADVASQHDNDIHQVSVAEIKPGDVRQIALNQRPIIIWRRSNEEIAQAMALLDPKVTPETWLTMLHDGRLAQELEADEFARLEWFVVSPINTGGMGCLVLAKAGDYRGFFDPCQSAHFDLWGRLQ